MSDFKNKKNYTNQTFFGKSCAEFENNADSGGSIAYPPPNIVQPIFANAKNSSASSLIQLPRFISKNLFSDQQKYIRKILTNICFRRTIDKTG